MRLLAGQGDVMSDNAVRWTSQQRLAIETRGVNVLVTASAGTGKTSVLSKRCVEILCDTNDVTDVSQILVLTFTEASAEEMKLRIAEELSRAASKSGNAFLRRQLLLLDAAHISTIDAFCKRLITDNFHVLGIDPMFRIIDADEQRLIKSEILDVVVEDAWAREDLSQGLCDLLINRNLQSAGGGFLKNIVGVNDFLGSVASVSRWHDKAKSLADIKSVCGSELAEKQKEIILDKLVQCRERLIYAIRLDAKFTEESHWSEQIASEYLATVEKCIESLEGGSDEYVGLVCGFSPAKFINKPKGLAKETADLIKGPVKKVKEILQELKGLAVLNPAYEEAVLPAGNLQTRVLLELVEQFQRRYGEAKDKLNCLDFADLEHLMLRLVDESPQVAQGLRNKFKYIFVDEYQDTNFLQQEILEKISRDDNVFVVGDVKQSIYAFRQAKPEIFLGLLKDAAGDEGGGKSLRVDLRDNFRSRKEVLDFANLIFSRIMTGSVAAVDYDERAFLRAGFDYEDSGGGPYVELNLIDENIAGAGGSEGVTASQRQAAFIAGRIKEMVGESGGEGVEIFDKDIGGYRRVQYRDIVILMRSPSTSVNDYLEILRLAGVPVSSQSSSGYFQAVEIGDMISLLKVLDNPQRDIELAAVMRSPMFGFSDTELAVVRGYDNCGGRENETSFYDCVLGYAHDGVGAELAGKLRDFLDLFRDWRAMACRGSLADLVWHVYRRTGYLSFVSGLPDGKQRRANLLKLHDRAIQFEGFSTNARNASLTRFVEFVEKLDAENHDWAPAQPDSSADNAVRIMSVHNSKGLEFPVVFLSEVNRKFNARDISAECLFDDDNALGLKVVDPKSKLKLSSIAHQVIADEKKKTLIAEEMRILYVAMTRARERLVVCGSVKGKKAAAIVAGCAVLNDECPQGWQLNSAGCHLDWVLFGLGSQRQVQEVFDVESEGGSDCRLFTVSMFEAGEINEFVGGLRGKQERLKGLDECGSDLGGKLLAKVKSSVGWEYAFGGSAGANAKMSVSELTHRGDEFSRFDLSDAFERLPQALREGGAETNVDPRQVGTATHLIIEKLDLAAGATLAAVKSLRDQLCDEGLIPEDAAAAVRCESIVAFFASEIGSLAVDPANSVVREWPFIYGLPAEEIDGQSKGEVIVVQGIVDMVIETPEGLVVVDFKTDNVSAEGAFERAKIYQQQIDLYSRAAAGILGKKVVGSWLYFLRAGVSISY